MGRVRNGQDAPPSDMLPAKKREKAGDQDGKIAGKALGRTVEAFMRLPGIGRKSAERLAFAVLGMPKEEAAGIAQAILDRREMRQRRCLTHQGSSYQSRMLVT